jgi:acetyl-CoA/propionyl-CoA carboxylase biotin carboxyl carrier protein
MLAKIVAAGADRADALARLTRALDGTVLLGLTTNLRFLRWLVRQPVVVDGAARVDTLERIWPPDDLIELTEPAPEAWATAARLLAEGPTRGWPGGPSTVGQPAGRPAAPEPTTIDPPSDPWSGGWRLNAPARLHLIADEGRERLVELHQRDGLDRPARRDRSEATDDRPASRPLAVRAADGTIHVDAGGRSVAFRLAPAPDVDRAAKAAVHHGESVGAVAAPMPGAVLVIPVRVGQSVEAGDPLVILEAMKMEHVVAAPGSGVVREMAVRTSDQVARGQTLLVLE